MKHWHEAARAVVNHVVQIRTPAGSGTGFLVAHTASGEYVGIATAAHVVSQCHFWEQPMRITHSSTGRSVFLRTQDRVVLANWERDTAAVVFRPGDLTLPKAALPLIASDKALKVGVEVGWLGYPGILLDGPCFFSGRVSLYRETSEEYLVDGVAIQGVSGAPAFNITTANARLIGVLSAYIPNRLTGESLPGLSVVMDVSSLKSQIEAIKSFSLAKKQETQPDDKRASPISQAEQPMPPATPSVPPEADSSRAARKHRASKKKTIR